MKVAFWITTNKYFDPAKLDNTPFGGCEIEAFTVGKALSQKYKDKCYVFANVSERYVSSDFMFFYYSDLPGVLERQDVDVFVVVRAMDEILSPRRSVIYNQSLKPKKVVLWSGDSYDQPNNELMHDLMTLNRIDKIILKSQWQKQTWLENFSRIDESKIAVIRKSFNVKALQNERQQVHQPQFIYASTAFRGMSKFLSIWPEIKKSIPRATLDCYGKVSLYSDEKLNREYEKLYKNVGTLEDVSVKDPISQKEFFEVLPNYYAMLYPNIFEETVCGVALEAMAAGVPVITTKSAGLVETIIDGGGILIDEVPHSKDYDQKFVQATIDLWNNGALREDLSMRGFKNIREKYDVDNVVDQWNNVLTGLFQ